MSNSETPTGGNGRKELEVNESGFNVFFKIGCISIFNGKDVKGIESDCQGIKEYDPNSEMMLLGKVKSEKLAKVKAAKKKAAEKRLDKQPNIGDNQEDHAK